MRFLSMNVVLRRLTPSLKFAAALAASACLGASIGFLMAWAITALVE